MEISTWQQVHTMAAVASAAIALLAFAFSWMAYRQSRHGDVAKAITDGDAQARAHTERHVEQMRAANSAAIAEIREKVNDIEDQLVEVRDSLARLETQQGADRDQMLRPRDLGAMHEKINTVSSRVAALEGVGQMTLKMVESINSYLREHK